MLLYSATIDATPHRVVLLTVDAGSNVILRELLDRGLLRKGFGRIVSTGSFADGMTPQNIASTPVSHATIYSGSLPSQHGIVGVSLPAADRIDGNVRSGFAIATDVPRLWNIVQQAGKRVVCIAAPGATVSRADGTCTQTLEFPTRIAPPRLLTLKFGEPREVKVADVAVSATADSLGVTIETPTGRCAARIGNPCVSAFPVNGDPAAMIVDAISVDELRSEARVMLSQAVTWPTNDRSFRDEILRAAGPLPGEPDSGVVTAGDVPEEAYVTEAELLTRRIGAAVRHEITKKDWDLLLVYLPLADNLEHRYLVTDPRQADYGAESGERRRRFAAFVERGYVAIDEIIATWLDADDGSTDFIVTSDHGMVPTHTTILLGNVVARAGYRLTGADPDLRIISSGASAHLYLNSRKRFTSGRLSAGEVSESVRKIRAALSDVKDPVTHRRALTILSTAAELKRAGLNHANSGDLIVTAATGFGVSARFEPAAQDMIPNTLSADVRARISRGEAETKILAEGRLNDVSPGIHGQFAGDSRLQSIFLAAGPDFDHRKIATVKATDIVPRILTILGIRREH